jgi:DNA-binding transcriptional ArsR family regulator
MSLSPTVRLRALAHPVRLRILSLLTGVPMSAAEVARELDLTHANASYHLRHLRAAGAIEIEGEERIRGGIAKRYRHIPELELDKAKGDVPADPRPTPDHLLFYEALAAELRRRSRAMLRAKSHVTDAELWVAPEVYAEVQEMVAAASRALHRAAVAPRTPGTVRVSATIALFRMDPEFP